MPQLEDAVRHGFTVSRFPDFWPYWGTGILPTGFMACASSPERRLSLGLFRSIFFLHLLKTAKEKSNSVRDQCAQLLLGFSFFRIHRIPLRGNCSLTELQLSGFFILL